MTPEDIALIAELEKLEAAMTPGEWQAHLSNRYGDWLPSEAVISHKSNSSGARIGRMVVWPGRDAWGDADATGIVALRNDALPLIRRLAVRVRELEDGMRAIATGYDKTGMKVDFFQEIAQGLIHTQYGEQS